MLALIYGKVVPPLIKLELLILCLLFRAFLVKRKEDIFKLKSLSY